MTSFKKILKLIILCLCLNKSEAQTTRNENSENEYMAIHQGVENGLSKDEVSFFLKDINGFIWMSTEYGLNRFDGSTYKKYFANKTSNKTITENNVTRLVEDSLHNIWIGSANGLSRYDIKADTFTHFFAAAGSDIADASIHPFFATQDNVYCIESSSGITSYNIHSLSKKTLIKLSPGEYSGYDMAILYSVFDPGSNSVWMLEGDVGRAGGGLFQISLSDGKRCHYSWNCYKNISNHSHTSEGTCYDKKRNCIWINSPDGLIQFTLNDKKFHSVNALKEITNLTNYDRNTVGIDIDSQGRIWFASFPKGIIIYDPSTQSITYPFAKDSVLQHAVSDANGCIYCDRDGITWSSSWEEKGIYQLNPFFPCAHRYAAIPGNRYSLSNNEVVTCVTAGNGLIYIGTSDGLNIFDPGAGRFQVLRSKDVGVKGSGKFMIPFAVNTAVQKAWLNSSDGLNEMNLVTHKCRRVIFKDSLGNLKKVGWVVAMPFEGGCIAECPYDNHMGIFIVKADSITAHQILDFPGDGIDDMNISTDGRYLFFRNTKTNTTISCSRQNDKWIKVSTPLDTVRRSGFSRIFYDTNDQTYWLISERQLFEYNRSFHLVNKYEVSEDISNRIYAMTTDKKGYIWFNTDYAICRLNRQTKKINVLKERDGFYKQYFDAAEIPMREDISGDLYFPSGFVNGRGFDRIVPDKFRETYPPAFVYLQSIKINQQPAAGTSINDLQALSLKYFQNNITIETGVIDYYAKGKNQIRYKLEPMNKEWQYAPSYYTIRYNGLPAGNYKLVIQASNAADVFNGPVKTLSINITPAFWNTWWFRILVSVFVLAVFYAVVRYRTKQKFRLQLERSEKEKQLAELQQQKTEVEMQALRAQMNPHFIFNCLNAINRFILTNETEAAANYLTKFSRLVRMVLSNSEEAFIPLEDELKSLQLYIDLEKLRFKNSFEYIIKISDNVNPANIAVPPLLLQPFVENAIWHGLMNKGSDGKVEISIDLVNEFLCCTITDNGIGRTKAFTIKSKSAEKNKSMGLQITKNRMALLNSNTNEHNFTINDLIDENGNAKGTTVFIKIKYKEWQDEFE
jgi:ligand-binding sensor domain-containing protein